LSLRQFLRSSYLFYFSQPVAERSLLRAVSRNSEPIRSIVEIGVGTGARTRRLLEVVGWSAAGDTPLKYTGIDMFEGRPAGTPGMSLKEAFNKLKTPNVKMQFVPGDPYQALARTANMLTGTDLLVISAGLDENSLAKAWMYIPRMLQPKTLVFLQERIAAPNSTADGNSGKSQVTETYKPLTALEIERLAAAGSKKSHRRAA
jgi:hypothetical protein